MNTRYVISYYKRAASGYGWDFSEERATEKTYKRALKRLVKKSYQGNVRVITCNKVK